MLCCNLHDSPSLSLQSYDKLFQFMIIIFYLLQCVIYFLATFEGPLPLKKATLHLIATPHCRMRQQERRRFDKLLYMYVYRYYIKYN